MVCYLAYGHTAAVAAAGQLLVVPNVVPNIVPNERASERDHQQIQGNQPANNTTSQPVSHCQ